MKNILLIMPYGGVGGMERLALSFYQQYLKIGYKVKALKIIKLKTDIINFGDDELYLKSYDFSEMSILKRFSFYVSAPKRIRKIINKHQITHTISFGDMSNLFSSLSHTKEYKIGSIHSLKSVEFKSKSIFNLIFKLSYKTTYQNLNKVVCISKDIKQDLIKNCGFKFINKLKVIYNPHNLDEINKLSKLPIENEKELKLISGNSIIFLGRLSIQKSPWHLVKAFSLVLHEIPDAVLIFIGDGDPNVENYLKELIIDLKVSNNIFFFGRKSNPYKYLAKAKVLALSSHYEGTPNVIVESICVGTPIVSSFCTKGITELMSLMDYDEIHKNVVMESGIVTPNLFKNKLGIPTIKNIFVEERLLAEALVSIIANGKHKINLNINKESLLSKFNIEKITNDYLKC